MSTALLICALASTLAGLVAATQPAVVVEAPPDAVRLHRALMPKVQPPVRAWIDQEARRLAMAAPKTTPDAAAVRAQVRSRFAGQPLGDMDVDSLVVLVMMESAAAEEKMMRDQLEQMKKTNAEKERLRALQAEARKQQGPVKDDLKAKYDSMSDLSQMQSMRLQMLMERRAKYMEMLSNLMKKIADTQGTLVGNLK